MRYTQSGWLAAIAMSGALAYAAVSVAAEESFFSKLNPFSSKESTPSTTSRAAPARKATSQQSSSWFQWPKLPGTSSTPATKKPVTRKSAEPSLWDKATAPGKKLWAGTKDALTPGNKKPAQVAQRPLTGYQNKTKPAKEEGNILTSWWKTKEPSPAKPKTPQDWMANERP